MRWTLLCIVYQPQHLIIKGLLESAGIPVQMDYEAVSQVQGITRGPLGEVKILVPEEYQAVATALLETPGDNAETPDSIK